VDSSVALRSALSTSGPASVAHCPIAANDVDPAITAAIPTASSPRQRVTPAALLPWVRDLGKQIKKMLAAGNRHGRRCHRQAESSRQAMVSVENFHRSARARPPPVDTPDKSPAAPTPQVTPSVHDFAVSMR